MLGLLRDTWASWRLQARYRRVVQERLLSIVDESDRPIRVEEDPERWTLMGAATGLGDGRRQEIRDRVRKLVQENCHGRNILRLLEAYVTGPGLALTHQVRDAADSGESRLIETAERLWREFLEANSRHYSFREHARRAWRDGETFVRKAADGVWPPQVRFVDPEQIAATPEFPESSGIVTQPHDVETPVQYLRVDVPSARLMEIIPAGEMHHTRVGVDSNVKRGVSIFIPILETLDCFDRWIDTELQARKLQSSIVLWRKVQGSPQLAKAMADGAASSLGTAGTRLEKFRPGTVLTTNHGTDIQFLQPNTNFGDAVPLGRMLLLNVAAGAGLPEFMLTSDASNSNFASTMVAEGPAVKFFQSEQQFFAGEFTQLWRWVMKDAVVLGLLPPNALERLQPHWSFPSLVNRDRPRERLADVQLVESGVLSRAEVARRDGVSPETMRAEREKEQE
jgi:capsid protein